ncbi:MAG: hypothetical protein ACJ76Y_23330 [Thermoanaerobaculia bacterium]
MGLDARAKFYLAVMLVLILLVGFSAFCIANYVEIPKTGNFGDLATVLFGAASLALFIISIFLALLAFFGWKSLQEHIYASAEKAANSRIEPLEKELRGRLFYTLGFAIGELSIEHTPEKVKSRERLAEAILNCQRGYSLLEGTGTPAEYAALNNLVYYSCLAGDTTRGGFILEKARLLLEAGVKHNSQDLMLTYVRAVIEFGDRLSEIIEARNIAQGILNNPRSIEQQRVEAKQYLASTRFSEASIKPTSTSA